MRPCLRGGKRRRVIDKLRRTFPALAWTYDAQALAWKNDAGWRVQSVALFAPRYEYDHDAFIVQYRRSDTGELVTI